MMDEKELIEHLKRGDTTAQEAFVNKYKDLIYNAIFQIARDSDLSKDVLQDTFIKALKNIKNFREDANLSTWLYRIAMNTLNDEFKRISRFRSLSDSDLESAEPSNYSFDQKKKIIFEGIRILGIDDKEVITLVDIQGLSYEEAAMLIGVPIGTVRSRLARARDKLRKAILESNFFDSN